MRLASLLVLALAMLVHCVVSRPGIDLRQDGTQDDLIESNVDIKHQTAARHQPRHGITSGSVFRKHNQSAHEVDYSKHTALQQRTHSSMDKQQQSELSAGLPWAILGQSLAKVQRRALMQTTDVNTTTTRSTSETEPLLVSGFEPWGQNVTNDEGKPGNATDTGSIATGTDGDAATDGAQPPTSPAAVAAPSSAARATCPATALPPPNLANQQALRSCPMVVVNMVQGRAADAGTQSVCSTVLLQNNRPELVFGWQVVWRSSNQPNPLQVTAISGAEMVSGSGLGAPYRVVNSATDPDISPGGGFTNFTLQHMPRDTYLAQSNTTASPGPAPPPAKPSQALATASLDWSGVFINGQYCSKIPSRSFLLDDCKDVRYGAIKPAEGAIQCISIFCCGDLDTPDQQPLFSPAPDADPQTPAAAGPAPSPVVAPSKNSTQQAPDRGDLNLGPPQTLDGPNTRPKPTVSPSIRFPVTMPTQFVAVPQAQPDVNPSDDGKPSNLVVIVVPSVVGSLVLAGAMAAMWAARVKKQLIRHLSHDQQNLQQDVAAVMSEVDMKPTPGSDDGRDGHWPGGGGYAGMPPSHEIASASVHPAPCSGLQGDVQGLGGTTHVLAKSNSLTHYPSKASDAVTGGSVPTTYTTLVTHGSGLSSRGNVPNGGNSSTVSSTGASSLALRSRPAYCSHEEAGTTGQGSQAHSAVMSHSSALGHRNAEGIAPFGHTYLGAASNQSSHSSKAGFPPPRPPHSSIQPPPYQNSVSTRGGQAPAGQPYSQQPRDMFNAAHVYQHVALPSTMSAPAPRIQHLLPGPNAMAALQPRLSEDLSSPETSHFGSNPAGYAALDMKSRGVWAGHVSGALHRKAQDPVLGLPLASLITTAQRGPLHAGLLEPNSPHHRAEVLVSPALLHQSPDPPWPEQEPVGAAGQHHQRVGVLPEQSRGLGKRSLRTSSWQQQHNSVPFPTNSLIACKSDPTQLLYHGPDEGRSQALHSSNHEPSEWQHVERDGAGVAAQPLGLVPPHVRDTPWTDAQAYAQPLLPIGFGAHANAPAGIEESFEGHQLHEWGYVVQGGVQLRHDHVAHVPPVVKAAPASRRWAAIDFSRDVVLQRKLGSGAFGTVYEAVWRDAPASAHALLKADHHAGPAAQPGPGDVSGDLAVAIKVVPLMVDSGSYNPKSLDALKQEIQVLSRLSHPHVVRFLGACLAPPNVCIVEELAAGGSLHAALHHVGPAARAHSSANALSLTSQSDMLSIREVLRLATEIAGAMSYLHSLKVVHRDLKAANVLLDQHGRALVADFGIAKFRDSTCLSTRNVHAGTPAYMAPEQFEGRPVTERVDQFAFGVLLWECLTRQLPWPDLDHPMQIIFVVGVQGERLPLPSHCPAHLASLISQCWSDEPAARPAFDYLYHQLRELLLAEEERGV